MPTRKPKAVMDVRSLARSHTQTCINVLVSIANCRKSPQAARVAAVTQLLDRGWGKAAQVIAGDPDNPVPVNISLSNKELARRIALILADADTTTLPMIDASATVVSEGTDTQH